MSFNQKKISLDLVKKENKMRDPVDVFKDLLNKYEEIKAENEKLKEEIRFLVSGFHAVGWKIVKSNIVPIGQMWINSGYNLGLDSEE